MPSIDPAKQDSPGRTWFLGTPIAAPDHATVKRYGTFSVLTLAVLLICGGLLNLNMSSSPKQASRGGTSTVSYPVALPDSKLGSSPSTTATLPSSSTGASSSSHSSQIETGNRQSILNNQNNLTSSSSISSAMSKQDLLASDSAIQPSLLPHRHTSRVVLTDHPAPKTHSPTTGYRLENVPTTSSQIPPSSTSMPSTPVPSTSTTATTVEPLRGIGAANPPLERPGRHLR